MKDLTESNIERQNVLNNPFAMKEIQSRLDITGMLFDGEYRFTKQMVADFYGITIVTVNRYLADYLDELKYNGYVLCKGKALKEFKLQFGHIINDTSKTTQLGLFDFRSFLNLGMLLTESEKAKQVRSLILDIVIETINKRTGGGTKFINRRDENYLPAAVEEIKYRKVLTEAIGRYVIGHRTYKYAQVTDMIYKAVFLENAKEYRELLEMKPTDNVKATLYAEVLRVISSFEISVGEEIKKRAANGNLLSQAEVENIVSEVAAAPMMQPFLHDARTKMASRDLNLRDVLHQRMSGYITPMSPEEFERFLGEQSVDFDRILAENADVLKRLKQADDDE